MPAWALQEDGRQVTSLDQLVAIAELQALADEALQANPGLQQTLLTLRISQAQLRSTRGERLPSVEATYSAAYAEGEAESYTGAVNLGWELDLWQKLADQERAAAMDAAQQEALYQAARDTLAATVMQTWLGMVAADHAVKIQEQRLQSLEQNEQFILQRYRNGLGTLEDLDSARSTVFSARATLETYLEAQAQQRRGLATLFGRSGGVQLVVPEAYPELVVALADLPEQTLQRRPDLQTAYLAIEAAD